jgi:hypothetical protein|eukprot:30391-Pelagococcus_subviridis.AAC.1
MGSSLTATAASASSAHVTRTVVGSRLFSEPPSPLGVISSRSRVSPLGVISQDDIPNVNATSRRFARVAVARLNISPTHPLKTPPPASVVSYAPPPPPKSACDFPVPLCPCATIVASNPSITHAAASFASDAGAAPEGRSIQSDGGVVFIGVKWS